VLLVPEARQDGTRTFRLVRGRPTPGYAIDIWRKYMAALQMRQMELRRT
jgi:hypothetical protein